MESLVQVVIVLVIVGVVLYLINNVVPSVPWVRVLINAIVGIFVLLWLLELLGFHTGAGFHLR